MNLIEILIEFTNEGRYKVFQSLYSESKRHNQLEKELHIPGPEISRNLKRLSKKELIKKEEDKYEITSTGKIIYQVLKIFEMSLKHKDYFNSHEIDAIPIEFILKLGTLNTIKINNQTMKNVQIWSDLVKNSEKFIMGISDQFQDSILPILEKKINNQLLEIRALVEGKILFDSVKIGQQLEDRHAFYEKIDAFKNVRVLERSQISLLATEKGSILFLSKDGIIDYSQCLFDTQESFINWTIELFELYWKKGKELKFFIKKENK